MPFNRKYIKRRRTKRIGRKRAYLRRTAIYRVPRNSNFQGTTKVFKWVHQTWTWSTLTTSDFWRNYVISLSSAVNYLNYANMYEQYKINWIKLTFYPQFDAVNLPASSTATPVAGKQYLVTASDPDNTIVPSGTYTATSLNNMMASQTAKVHEFKKPVHVLIRGPKVLEDVTGITSSRSVRSPWLFTTATGVTAGHNACQAFWYQSGFDTTPGATYADVYVTMSVSFKDIKL